MKIDILDKFTKLNRIIETHPVDIVLACEVCEVASDELGTFVLLVDAKGQVLSNVKPMMDDTAIELFYEEKGDFIEKSLNERLLRILSINDNASLELLGLDSILPFNMMVVPVVSDSVRCATMVLYRLKEKFDLDDIIYVEHVKSILAVFFGAMEFEKRKQLEKEKENLDNGIFSLSKAELSAAGFVLDNLSSDEGIVVAKDVANCSGVSRSVIVSALKKLESAGVIECRSVGSKGTYIKIINDFLRDSIDTLRQEK